MQIVIEIPEKRYKDIQRIADVQLKSNFFKTAEQIIANGTPLPKGHGKIVDVNEVIKIANKTKDLHGAIWNAPTIIEADNAESEE